MTYFESFGKSTASVARLRGSVLRCLPSQRLRRWPYVLALTAAMLVPDFATAQVGTNYCTPAVANSTGAAGHISASGTSNLSQNNNRLSLAASDLPQGQFGIFMTSRTQGLVVNLGGSFGNMCLGGVIGRYRGSGQVLNTGAAGSFHLSVDLSSTPEGGTFVQVAAGESWNFQAWYRDAGPTGQASSNFTDGLQVLFTTGSGAPIPGMVPIPAGTFMMGSRALNVAPYFNNAVQKPVHQVTISYAFWMGQHEVTQAEYQALMGVNPSCLVGANRPVECVNWNHARAYCAALTAQEAGNLPPGFEYRLPTEAEWEYACRGGTTTEFHYGPDLFCHQARFWFSHHSTPGANCNNPSGTAPVGSYPPNGFGLYDMHGNLWEWCLDSFRVYTAAPVTDPFVGGGFSRVGRGGSWRSVSDECRSATRTIGFSQLQTGEWLGFRVVLAPVVVP
jgi:formylglycine-generating enzyme required for sulfatase activity